MTGPDTDRMSAALFRFLRGPLLLAWLMLACVTAFAAETPPQKTKIPTPAGNVLVEKYGAAGGSTRPAIIMLSGSRGLAAPAYGEIAHKFQAAGMDVFLLHYLTPEDIDAIERAGSASARKRYYDKRLPHWTASVRAVVATLKREPLYGDRVGLLGISLGANVAAASAANASGVSALVLVDGGFPESHAGQVRSIPPLLLIWGSADQVFPLSTGRSLQRTAAALGGTAILDIYDGARHDFFIRPGHQAQTARERVTRFLLERLAPKP
ncbi:MULTISPECIES: dienelactone hydrolase family protein [unclassified Mesorhizobium]|uniref:dienelactone hydrolase family protein n=1 Tax=unclassified Mesorhizobium TaxID=325217 RepID=UPI0030157E16